MEPLPETDVDLGAPELRGRIAGDTLTVTIDRPEKRNAVTADGYHGIKRAAMIVADEPGLDFLVITGTGDTFCTGGEMNVTPSKGSWDSFTDAYDATPFVTLGMIPKLVVCAVNGMCLGGGLVMSLFADLVIASDDARFRVPDLTRGVYEAFVAARLPQRVGTLHANHLLYENDWIDPVRAEELGLVGRVVPRSDLEAATARLLDRVRATGPVARAAMKAQMARALPAVDVAGYWSTIGTAEQIEAWAAFTEKRPPSWPAPSPDRDGFAEFRRSQWQA